MFGDLDVSTLREKPPGRQPRCTRIWATRRAAKPGGTSSAANFARGGRATSSRRWSKPRDIRRGQRRTTARHAGRGPLEDFRLGLVHGRISPAERTRSWTSFRAADPGAGRDQRGRGRRRRAQRDADDHRGGRAVRAGPAAPAARPDQPRRPPRLLCVFAAADSDEARQRLEAFERSTDGFELAEIDFQLRGPGDLVRHPAARPAFPVDDPGALPALEERLRLFPASTIPGLPPFQGGAAGLFSYDLNRTLECVPAPRVDEFRVPALAVGLYDVVLAFDHAESRAWLISQGFPETGADARRRRAAERLAQFQSMARGAAATVCSTPSRRKRSPIEDLAPQFPARELPELTSNFSPDDYRRADSAGDRLHPRRRRVSGEPGAAAVVPVAGASGFPLSAICGGGTPRRSRRTSTWGSTRSSAPRRSGSSPPAAATSKPGRSRGPAAAPPRPVADFSRAMNCGRARRTARRT
jgi:hypothetical protein